jgi:hypothetical protein
LPPILEGRDHLRRRDVTLIVAGECRHHADARHLDTVLEMQRGPLFHRFDILGVAAVQVLLGEPFRRRSARSSKIKYRNREEFVVTGGRQVPSVRAHQFIP